MSKPILFSTPMVRQILADRKTKTRRVAKISINGNDLTSHSDCVTYKFDVNHKGDCVNFYDNKRFYAGAAQVRYKVGDVLWVRETWAGPMNDFAGYIYRSEFGETEDDTFPPSMFKWHPSIFMPKVAARIFLRVTDVRVERVQDITNNDAIKEGCSGAECDCLHLGRGWMGCESCMNTGWQEPPIVEFMQLWDGLNKKRGYGWADNPWVWVYSFDRTEKEGQDAGK